MQYSLPYRHPTLPFSIKGKNPHMMPIATKANFYPKGTYLLLLINYEVNACKIVSSFMPREPFNNTMDCSVAC